MKRTISIKLLTTNQQDELLCEMQTLFAQACNSVVPFVVENHCTNAVKLHHLAYYAVREVVPNIGSQMVCNAIRKVSSSYKSLAANRKLSKKDELPITSFSDNTSIHFDKRTYTLKDNAVSLFTTQGRIIVPMKIGVFQQNYLDIGKIKEAELIKKQKGWFFNLVLDIEDTPLVQSQAVLGVDVGENNLATTSSGLIFGGDILRHERQKYLQLRKRLQRNGSKAAKRKLKKISGKESRHIKDVNHVVSKTIVFEAVNKNCSHVILENLTNIRTNIKAGKRVRARLHGWAFRQLQAFIEYKAQAQGIQTEYINPAYTSQTCAVCGNKGVRNKHKFSCKLCGRLAHADLNASQNIASLGYSILFPTVAVNLPNVATF